MKISFIVFVLGALVYVQSYEYRDDSQEGLHVGDGKTYTYSNTVTRDGKTHSTNIRTTDNSVVANGIHHSGGGTVNIGNLPNQPGKWWNSNDGDLNIGKGDRSERGFQEENRDTASGEKERMVNSWRDDVEDSDDRVNNENEDVNIENGNKKDERSKRGVWDVKVDTKTDVNWRQDNINYRDNSVTSNNNFKYGNGNLNIGNGDRSKRGARIDYTRKDNSIWVKDATVIGRGNINIGNGDRSKRGVWDVKVDTNTNVNWRKDNIDYKDNSVVSNGNVKFGEGHMNIGNGDRSKRHSVTHIDNSIKVESPTIVGSGVMNIGNGRRGRHHSELYGTTRSRRAFDGSVAIHDRRTKPGPPVNLDNLEGRGSVHIIIDDNTDPITLRGAKIYGSAMVNIGG